jgi:hypothetical protein
VKSALVVVIVGSGLVVGCGGGSAKGDASDAAKGDAPAEVGAADGGGEASAPDVAMTVDAAPDLASDAAPNDVAGDARGDTATGDAQADGGSDAAVPFLTPYPRFVSGTRLRARYVKDENGTSAQTILRDTTLDVDCVFEPAETGVTRCVPVDRGYVVFADAQCKNPLAQSGLCYLKKWAGLSDSTGNHVYKVDVGGVVTKPTTIWLAGEDENGAATCTASATAAGDQFVPAQLQPDSSFVAATGAPVTETRPGARIGARYWVGADNSKAYVGLYDNARAANCDVLPVGTGARRCFSGVQPATMIYFGDAQCSVQLFMSPGANAPAYARATRQPAANEPSCAGGRWTMRKIGPKHTGQLYRRSGTACTPATAPAGSTPYTLEDGDVGAQLLVTLTDELQGGPRLKALGLRGSDGSAVDGDGQRFIDTKFNETCTATLFDVGDHYCAPAFTGAAEGYADAACSIVAYQYPDEACLYEGGTVATHHVIFKDGGCGERVATDVWLRGAAVTPLYDTAGGTCGVVPGNTSLYYRRAQSPPPSTFAWVDVKTE